MLNCYYVYSQSWMTGANDFTSQEKLDTLENTNVI